MIKGYIGALIATYGYFIDSVAVNFNEMIILSFY